MDPNPNSFPMLSYVLSRLPSFGAKHSPTAQSDHHFDIEQPSPRQPVSDPSTSGHSGIYDRLPHLKDPNVFASMTRAVADVAQTRSVLKTLGPRPDHEAVDTARAKLAEIESELSKQLEEVVLTPRPVETDRLEWRAQLADKENECRRSADNDKSAYKALLQLDEMHEAYEQMLKEAEERLARIYEGAERQAEGAEDILVEKEEVNEEVVGILQKASGPGLERVDLSGRKLRLLPEAFGKIHGLRVLILSNNQLEVIPDSIAGLENLEELYIASNILESLPDSIGLLHNLKILDASGNKLHTLPDSICYCRSLVELDVSFNQLTYLPTNIGYELVKLRRLSVYLNKLRSLPTTIGEMKSLCILDAHFNELHGLPPTIGRLTNLEILNISSNFTDLTELPDTIGDLIELKELDLSNNQIHALPCTFGRLDNLRKLNLDQNPLVVPPMDVVKLGVEAIKDYMAKRWLDILVEEEEKSMLEVREESQTGWLTRSTSWLKNYVSGVSDSVSDYMGSGGRSPRDAYLNQQF